MKTNLKTTRAFLSAVKKSVLAMSLISISASGVIAQTNTFPPSGNAGVGTNSPALQSGTTNTMLEVRGTVNPGVGLTSTAAGGRQYFVYSSQTNPGYFSVFDATAGADRFVINNNGNVGIGAVSPAYRLDVNGTVNATGGFQSLNSAANIGFRDGDETYRAHSFWIGNTNADGGKYAGLTNYPGANTSVVSDGIFFVAPYTNNWDKWVPTLSIRGTSANGAGNVGIGTTNPSSKFHVSGSSNTRMLYMSDSAHVSVYTSGAYPGTFAGDGLTVNSNPDVGYSSFVIRSGHSLVSDRGLFRILRYDGISPQQEMVYVRMDGNVGIGTTSPGQKLSVVGTVESTSGGFKFPDGSVQTTAASGGASSAANVAAGQFGANTGGGNYTFPGVLTLNGGSSSNWGALNVGGTASINAAGNIYSYSKICAGNNSGNCDQANGVVIAGSGTNTYGNVYLTGSGNTYFNGGNVGIGTTTPANKLHVAGSITVDGNINAKYQDLAEWVPSSEQLSAGTVVVLDTTKSNQVVSATISYDTRVAGVISAQPGITLGESGEGKVLVATTGRVRVKVDASRGPIQIGDLLVTSHIPGVAMKSEAVNLGGVQIHRPGTIIGKALEPLARGQGEILVLLSLQ